MEINVIDDERIVSIWLTNAEKESEEIKESLKPIYDKYKKEKYLVAVFLSGDGNLFDGTKDLLLHNRKAN